MVTVLLPAVVTGCFEDPEDPAGARDETVVLIKDDVFEPDALTVAVGQTVTWRHEGARNHTVTIPEDSPYTGASLFNVGDPGLAPGNEVTFQFPERGEYIVYCRYHSDGFAGMRMLVRVT
jgi:plastocyanin